MVYIILGSLGWANPVYIGILFGLVMIFAHFFSDRLNIVAHRMKIISLVAGIFITYLFLHLFPQLYQAMELRISFIFLLAGFTIIHVIEKHIYKSTKNVVKIKKELKWMHSVTFFIYHFVIGMVLIDLLSMDIKDGVLFFAPLLIFSTISTMSLKEIHVLARKSGIVKLLLSASSFLGIVFTIFVSIPPIVFDVALGVIVGTMLHLILMDAIPKEREGEPAYFVLGVVLYTILITLTWIF